MLIQTVAASLDVLRCLQTQIQQQQQQLVMRPGLVHVMKARAAGATVLVAAGSSPPPAYAVVLPSAPHGSSSTVWKYQWKRLGLWCMAARPPLLGEQEVGGDLRLRLVHWNLWQEMVVSNVPRACVGPKDF